MSTKDPEAFGEAVLRRRDELGLSQLQVWDRGGPSNTTLTVIENGRLTELSPSTAKKLDRGLGWTDGSALSLWREGKVPTAQRAWAAPDYSGPTWVADSDDPWVPAQVALKDYVDSLVTALEEDIGALTERVIDLEHQIDEMQQEGGDGDADDTGRPPATKTPETGPADQPVKRKLKPWEVDLVARDPGEAGFDDMQPEDGPLPGT